MRPQKRNAIILSASLGALSKQENARRHFRLSRMLGDIDVPFMVVVHGMYKGVRELSFLCVPENDAQFETVVNFGLINFEQESVLLNIHQPTAELAQGVYLCTGKIADSERIGSDMVNISAHEAQTLDAYTYRPDAGTYWVAR
jgi:hypothetical protein